MMISPVGEVLLNFMVILWLVNSMLITVVLSMYIIRWWEVGK